MVILILSIKYFIRIEKKIIFKILPIFLLCLFSSLALYTRPYLIFFLYLLFCIQYLMEKKIYKIFNNILFSFLSSGLYILYIWGGILKIGISSSDQVSLAIITILKIYFKKYYNFCLNFYVLSCSNRDIKISL